MYSVRNFVCVVAALTMTSCTSGSDPDTARTTSFDGELLRLELTLEDGSKEKFSSVRDEWFSWSWMPVLPNHVGRRWALIKNQTEGTSFAYALVSWDNDDPTDYLAAGYWLWFPGSHPPRLPLSEAEMGVFIDGPEVDASDPPQLPVLGTATYVGEAGGLYEYGYGSGWPGLDEAVETEEFAGTINITADFADNTVTGCIGCIGDIEIRRAHLYTILGGRVELPLALPTDYELRFGRTKIDPNGTFESADVTVSHPGRTVTQSDGKLSGSFSNKPDLDGNPRLVTGIAGAKFDEGDGSRGSFQAIFTALGESLLPAGARQEQ